MEDRIQREREFHNREFTAGRRSSLRTFYSAARKAEEHYEALLFSRAEGRRVLEYGCGPGSYAIPLARRGADVSAIDISETAIEQARRAALREDVDVEFAVMNAEELCFGSGEFDLACGSGILHHLDLARAYAEVSRVLKPHGEGVFIEPLGHNPLLRLFRRLTPRLRTRDEHPLRMGDIRLAERHFGSVDTRCFCLLALLAAPLAKIGGGGRALSVLTRADDVLFRVIPPVRRHAWIAAITLAEPRRVSRE